MSERPSGLPTPAEMRAFNEASQAAWQAARMREASQGLVTGHIALGICLLGTALVVMRLGANAPFIACALLFGYLGCLIWAIRRVKGQRLKGLVKVIDRREVQLRKAIAKPIKAALIFLGIMCYNMLCGYGWMIAFRHMSNSAILASLAITPVMGIGYFVYRAVKFAFWEDLLFAACIALAYLPIFFEPGPLAPLSFLALILVLVGTASLQHRWEAWLRSLNDLPDEGECEEVGS